MKRPGGETGRRARFRCESRKVWGFESLPGHKEEAIMASSLHLGKLLLQKLNYFFNNLFVFDNAVVADAFHVQ